MADPLKAYLDQNLLSKENVLREVDEYSLFCHYIGADLELRSKYSSPIRTIDDDPSFSLYYGKRGNMMFKDNGIQESGDIFKFLQLFMGGGTAIPIRQVLLQINADLDLGFEGEDVPTFKPNIIKKSPPKKKSPAIIQITKHTPNTSEFVDYWNFLNVDENVRKLFRIHNPNLVHFIQDGNTIVISPKDLCISYEILGTYKIYQPNSEKVIKFRNNYKPYYVEGMLQLRNVRAEFCIITKSLKECAFFYANFGFHCVAGTSETAMIHPKSIAYLRERFQTILIWLDNDEAGRKATSKYLEAYPFLVPVDTTLIEEKDPTDEFKKYKLAGEETFVLSKIKNIVKSTWQNSK